MSTEDLQILEEFPAVEFDRWRAVVDKDLKGADFAKRLVSRLYEGVDVQPLYMRESADPPAPAYPGQGDFVRGGAVRPGGELGWTIAQVAADARPDAANAAILGDLAGGASGIVLRLHHNARAAAAASDPEDVAGGVHCDRQADFATVLKDVELGWIETNLDAGAAAVPAAIEILALAKSRGVDLAQMQLHVNADPLATLAEFGCLRACLDGQLAAAAALITMLKTAAPKATVLAVSSRPYHAAGATATQEIAAIAATGVAYLRRLEALGVDPATAAVQMVLQVPVGCDQFLEIAKIRALRKVWAQVLTASGVTIDRIRVQGQISERMLTAYDPWVNMLRGTVSCFAGAVAGCDSLSIAPFDAKLGPADELGRRIARNTQIILQEEAHLAQVTDPAGGSWYVESLTADLATEAWTIFQQIEADGGMLSVLRDGSFRDAVKEVWAKRDKNIGKRKDPITGISEFALADEELPTRPLPTPSELRAAASTPAGAVADEALERVDGRDDIAGLVAAAAAGADLADLAAAVLVGEDLECKAMPAHGFADGFEALRRASDAADKRPAVFLANLGPIAVHTVRATWSSNFFQAAGIDVLSNDGFADVDAAVAAFKASGASMALICSSDAYYPENVPQLGPALKDAGATAVLLAGRPGDNEAAWREAGVDGFIYLGCPVQAMLTDLLQKEGVLA